MLGVRDDALPVSPCSRARALHVHKYGALRCAFAKGPDSADFEHLVDVQGVQAGTLLRELWWELKGGMERANKQLKGVGRPNIGALGVVKVLGDGGGDNDSQGSNLDDALAGAWADLLGAAGWHWYGVPLEALPQAAVVTSR
eukprot:CAMPEP_0117665016 /NCGR_PEP_ID=MMETSP0804-20121206/9564_1 /TAXON_ID=1074897 /ORGANISM="Tetraselmis astigmatica, Strain CCMP880" /LENGTH=141 /DNA_ID=CAMNT_0005472359 /DNA_START=541 /DNA_END=966 /DNA_ORIENTATION=-